jgi:hypothetical protein
MERKWGDGRRSSDFVNMPVNRSLRMLWRAESCSAKDQKYAAVETALPLGK